MRQSTYRHYPSFTRRYVRSVLKMMGLPKKPRVEAKVFASMLQDQELALSINGEMLMLDWHHAREGRVVVPEPTLSQWLQAVKLSQVQGNAWSWPWEFCTLSFPTSQTFHGHPVDGTLVTWVDSTSLPGRFESFLGTHGNTIGVDMLSIGEPWLMVAIQNPLDTQPSVNLAMLRGALSPQQISDFINREAIELAGPILMKSKHPERKKGIPFVRVGVDSENREPIYGDDRFYRGKWADHCRGSRYVLVRGCEVGVTKTVGSEPVEEERYGRSYRQRLHGLHRLPDDHRQLRCSELGYALVRN